MDDDLETLGDDEDEVALGLGIPKASLDAEITEEAESADDELEAVDPEPATLAVAASAEKPRNHAPVKVRVEAGTEAGAPNSGKPPRAAKARPAKPEPKSAPATTIHPDGKAAAAGAKPGVSANKTESAPAPAVAKTPAAAEKKSVPASSSAQGSKVAKPAANRPAAAKAQASHLRRVPAKVAVKAASRTAARALPVKPAAAHRKPAPAVRATGGNSQARTRTSKPSKPSKPFGPSGPGAKKPALKPAKRR
ncbi:MAG: hypothetical protein ACREKE_05210 [bacterium]